MYQRVVYFLINYSAVTQHFLVTSAAV